MKGECLWYSCRTCLQEVERQTILNYGSMYAHAFKHSLEVYTNRSNDYNNPSYVHRHSFDAFHAVQARNTQFWNSCYWQNENAGKWNDKCSWIIECSEVFHLHIADIASCLFSGLALGESLVKEETFIMLRSCDSLLWASQYTKIITLKHQSVWEDLKCSKNLPALADRLVLPILDKWVYQQIKTRQVVK